MTTPAALPTPARLLAALGATWAAPQVERIGGWEVRRGFGAGSRASAIRPAGDPGMAEDDALDRAAAMQCGWGQTPIVQTGPGDGALDTRLAARGWTAYDASLILVAPTAALPDDERLMAVRVRAPVAALDELWAAGGIGPPRRAVMAATPGPKDALLIRAEDRPAAALFVAADREIAFMSALHVDPAFRRRGIGRAAARAAADWAVEHGAEWLALAVTETNAAARALYAGLGFVEGCRYRYRRAPG